MSNPLGIIHGAFGRVVLLDLDHSMVRHAHRDCHVIFKISGPDVLFGVRQKEHRMTNSNVTLVNAWEPHFYTHRHASESVRLLTFYFRPDWAKQIDRRLVLCGHPKFLESPCRPLSANLRRLRDDAVGCLTDYVIPGSTFVSELMTDLFLGIIDQLHLPDILYPAGPQGELGYDPRIRRIVETIKDCAGAPVCLEELADSADLSRAQFFRLFNKSTGMAPATFVNMIRMETSLKNLAQPDIPIQEIAQQMGYTPAGNFTRFFTSQQGLSPSNYRKAIAVTH